MMKEILFHPEVESKNLEFKAILPPFHTLIKTCVAFANGFGGQIVIGIDDKSRQILGINDKARNRLCDEFPKQSLRFCKSNPFGSNLGKRYNDVSVFLSLILHQVLKTIFHQI